MYDYRYFESNVLSILGIDYLIIGPANNYLKIRSTYFASEKLIKFNSHQLGEIIDASSF